MRYSDLAVVDFETHGIDEDGRPYTPPEPVGVSIRLPGARAGEYFGWGHPTGNNSTKGAASDVLKSIWNRVPTLFFNGAFDVDVAQSYMGCGHIASDKIHDAQWSLFLHDPNAHNLQLKPSYERLFGKPPDEQNAVRDWLIKHQPAQALYGRRITKTNFGEFICLAPGDLVGRYANGDVKRTYDLFKLTYDDVVARSMTAAYEREQRLLPILLQNSREGMRVDLDRLERDLVSYEAALVTVEHWLRRRLKAPDLEFNKRDDVAEALDRTGVVTEWEWSNPKVGSPKRLTSKKVLLPEHFNDPKVYSALGYRNRLYTALSTFMRPWFKVGSVTGGTIHTDWRQVRGAGGGDDNGARTGRLQSSPNMQNAANDFTEKNDGYFHPAFMTLPPLPLVRRYIVADSKDHVIGKRDFNSQELRLLASYEDGPLQQQYNENPMLDVHQYVSDMIKEQFGMDLHRKVVKIINFSGLYGAGVGKMAGQLKQPVEQVAEFRKAQKAALPGIYARGIGLDAMLQQRWREGESIRTIGGRLYYVEDPITMPDGKVIEFYYKALNALIQSSASDWTKESLIRYHQTKKDGRFMVTVHDEIDVSVPKKALKSELLILRDAMNGAFPLDVPMISDPEAGANMFDLEKVKE